MKPHRLSLSWTTCAGAHRYRLASCSCLQNTPVIGVRSPVFRHGTLHSAAPLRYRAKLTAVLWLFLGVIAYADSWASSPHLLTIVYTAQTLGNTELCGCSPEQTGGLPRRAGLIGTLQGARVSVDLGGVLPPVDHLAAVLKSRQTAVFYRSAGYDAVLLSRADLEHGTETVRKLLGELPLVAASVPPTLRGSATGWRIAERNGVKLGIVAAGDDESLEQARHEADGVIVLGEALDGGPPDMVFGLGRGEVALILGGKSMVTIAGGRVVEVPRDFGDRVGLIQVQAGEVLTWSEPRIVLLDATTPEDEAAQALLARVKDEVVPLLPKPGRVALGDGFIGSSACQGCHLQEYQSWQASPHAHAFATLEDQGVSERIDCVPCHTFGFDRQQLGYAKPNVHCESCHGRRREHVTDAVRVGGDDAKSACVACHNTEHSPTFYFPTYWETIKHGATSSPALGGEP